MNELQCRSQTSQRKCRYMMHPPKQFSFGISICSVCCWRRMPKCQIQNKGKFVRRRLVMFWTSSEDLLTRFSTQDETRVPHLIPESKNASHKWNHPAPRSPKKKELWSQPARWWWQCSGTLQDFCALTSWIMALTWTGILCLSSETAVSKKHREKTWRDAKRRASARMTIRRRISAVQPSTKRWTVAPKCYRICLFSWI